ncbi:MAG: DUF6517 family protein, partial [Halovenus sp.]
LAAISGGAVVSLSGCALLGDEIEQSADPARVSEQALQGTGYSEARMEDQSFEQTVEINDEERDLRQTNWVTEYRKLPGETEQSAASFLIFTTPTVTVAGQSANPFNAFSEEQLIRRLTDQSGRGDATDLEKQRERETEILGESVTLSIYQTTQSVAGQDVDVTMYFGNLANDSDLLFLLGAHPELLDESENIYQLAEGIEHPVDP